MFLAKLTDQPTYKDILSLQVLVAFNAFPVKHWLTVLKFCVFILTAMEIVCEGFRIFAFYGVTLNIELKQFLTRNPKKI